MHRHGPVCLAGPISKRKRNWKSRADREIRHELVARVRREIAAGTYDTPAKMEQALDRLLKRLEQA